MKAHHNFCMVNLSYQSLGFLHSNLEFTITFDLFVNVDL